MTQDEIIRMAVECQLLTTSPRDGLYAQSLEAFAKLVAAKEREACAKVCEKEANNPDEREDTPWVACAQYLANNIRARGEA